MRAPIHHPALTHPFSLVKSRVKSAFIPLIAAPTRPNLTTFYTWIRLSVKTLVLSLSPLVS